MKYQCSKCQETFAVRAPGPDGHCDHACLKCGQLLQWDDSTLGGNPRLCNHALRLKAGSLLPLVKKG
jgi:hypothetical protein